LNLPLRSKAYLGIALAFFGRDAGFGQAAVPT